MVPEFSAAMGNLMLVVDSIVPLVIRVALAVMTLQSEAVRRRDKESTLPQALWSTGDGPVEENLR